MCAIYILGTVVSGYPLFYSVMLGVERLEQFGVPEVDPYAKWVAVLDALFYIFTPQIFTTLIRVVQGRPLGHRIAGRSVVIGDVPMVAQPVEAMASKLFACTYSNTGTARASISSDGQR